MKIISYTIFVSSHTVRKLIIQRGVDPDTEFLNDFKFMKAVFHILVIYIFKFKYFRLTSLGINPVSPSINSSDTDSLSKK
jgi:hypothetical protein